MSKYRALVIGGNGFLGRQLAAELIQKNNEVLAIGSSESFSTSCEILRSLDYPIPAFREIESIDLQTIRNLLLDFRPDVVFQMAGRINRTCKFDNWNRLIHANVITTASVISAISSLTLGSRPLLIMPGSQMEYGLAKMPWKESSQCEPTNPYGASKLLSTELALAAIRSGAIKGCIIRLPIIFGPGQAPQMLIPELMVKSLNNVEISMSSGQQKRRFLLSKDVANFFHEITLAFINSVSFPTLINAPASHPISILTIANTITKLAGTRKLLRIGDLTDPQNEIMEAWPDSTLAETLIQSSITNLNIALQQVYEWYKGNQWFANLYHNNLNDKNFPH